MISGRIVLSASSIAIDGNDVIAVDGCGAEEDGSFVLGYSSECEPCGGTGYGRGHRCDYCGLDAEGRNVSFAKAWLTGGDVALLREWARKGQFHEDTHVMARTLLAGLREWDEMAGAPTERAEGRAA